MPTSHNIAFAQKAPFLRGITSGHAKAPIPANFAELQKYLWLFTQWGAGRAR
jgi:hypothetical protein